MMQQYNAIKKKHKDSILFFRLGDFYEMFYQDATTASSVLGLTLTGRGKDDQRVPMCGIPFHAAEGYVSKLVKQGYKVAICEQVEAADATKAQPNGMLSGLSPWYSAAKPSIGCNRIQLFSGRL